MRSGLRVTTAYPAAGWAARVPPWDRFRLTARRGARPACRGRREL